MNTLCWLLTVAAHSLVAIGLMQTLGIALGFGIFACLSVIMTAIAGYLLYGSVTNEITWRNRVAGLLLPWSLVSVGERLSTLLITNLLASLIWCALVAASFRLSLLTLDDPASATTPSMLTMGIVSITVLCRVSLFAGWVLGLRSIWKSGFPSALIKRTWPPLVLTPLAILSSIVLESYSYAFLALLAVGIPLCIVLTPLLLMLASMAFSVLTGKKIRWN